MSNKFRSTLPPLRQWWLPARLLLQTSPSYEAPSTYNEPT